MKRLPDLAFGGFFVIAVSMNAPVCAGVHAGERIAFLACPVVQDTDSVPCWLSSDGRERYYLGIQVDVSAPFHPPQLKHKVLVEGTVSDEPRICGGIVLKPVTLSVMPELDRACDTLVAAGKYSIIDPPRGPGPSNRGKRIASDASFVPPVAPAPAQPPAVPKTFTIPFSFDGLYMDIHAFSHVLEAAHYAQAIHANHIELVGYRGSVRLSNAGMMVENGNIAELRARKVNDALKELVLGSAPDVRWIAEAEAADQSPNSRRVEIIVSP